MRYRLIHNQGVQGKLYIDDIESGLPNEKFGISRKQPVYIGYYYQYFDQGGYLQVDKSRPGYIDLVPSDKVELSRKKGTIAGMEDAGWLTVVEISDALLGAPSISTATFDGDGSQTEAYEVAFTVTDDASAGDDFTITINGSASTYSDAVAGADPGEVADQLAAAVNGNGTVNSDVTAVSDGVDTVTVTTDEIGTTFTFSSSTTGTGSITETVTDTGRLVITGTKLNSTAPLLSKIVVRDDSSSEEVELTEDDIIADGGEFTDTRVVILGTTHGLGSASGDVESVDVTADGQTATSAVTEL